MRKVPAMQSQYYLLGAVLFLHANPIAAQEASEIATKIDAYAAPFVEAEHLSGTLLVARGNNVLYERS